MGHRTVMLSAAKHLAAQGDRPFASLRVTVEGRFHHPSYLLKVHNRPPTDVYMLPR